MAIWPETYSRSPTRMPWLYGPMAAGARGVVTVLREVDVEVDITGQGKIVEEHDTSRSPYLERGTSKYCLKTREYWLKRTFVANGLISPPDMDRTSLFRTALCTVLMLVAFLLGLGGGEVLADEGRRASPDVRGTTSSPLEVDTIRAPKRTDVAVLSSVGGTLLPTAGGVTLINRVRDVPAYRRDGTTLWRGVGSLAAGLVVGPSLGHFYAQNHDQAWTGMAIRGGAATSGMLALWAYPFQEEGGPTPGRASSGSEPAASAEGVLSWVMVASAAVLVSRSVYDLLSTPQAVQEYNVQPTVRAQVVPHVSPTGTSGGLTLRLQF